MSDPNEESQFKKALAENGSFDPERAEDLKRNTVGAFEAKMRKVERYLFAYLCLLSWLLVFTLFHFLHATTTKALVAYGLLMLVFLETTVLMKLWYWIMNNKISVLKAIKQIELGGHADDQGDAFGAGRKLEGPLVGLSRRERSVWWGVLVAGAAAIGAFKSTDVPPNNGSSLTSYACATLAADGSGTVVTDQSFLNEGIGPTRGRFNYYAPKAHKIRFTDSRGREFPVTTSPSEQADHTRYEVTLPHVNWPGRRFSYTQISEGPHLATRDGDVWTYSTDYSYGCDTSRLFESVVLPEGAEILSAEPWPMAQFTLGGKPSVRFEGIRGRNEPFKFTVRYRLPAEKTQ